MRNSLIMATVGWVLFMLAGVVTGNEAWFPVSTALFWIEGFIYLNRKF
jgi:hypothetical protein